MKAKTLSAALAFASLMAMGQTGLAAGGPHDGYDHAFFGTTSPQGGDAMGQTGMSSTTADGHLAYSQAFYGKSGGKPQMDTMGKAAYGTSNPGIDGDAAYRSAFRGD